MRVFGVSLCMLCKACANAATNAVDSRDISVLCGIDTTGDTVGVSGLSAAVIAAEFRSASPVDVATSAKNIKSVRAKLPVAISNTCLDVPFSPSQCRGIDPPTRGTAPRKLSRSVVDGRCDRNYGSPAPTLMRHLWEFAYRRRYAVPHVVRQQLESSLVLSRERDSAPRLLVHKNTTLQNTQSKIQTHATLHKYLQTSVKPKA
uniref:Putative secreted protein n=1 Tax=Ixodes ricinus TaxID=34613 RepID=A0A6B0V2K6_IXORI